MSPKLPNVVSIVYNNIIFKFLIILFIIFLSIHDQQLAIMVTSVYLLIIHRLNNIEKFGMDFKKFVNKFKVFPIKKNPPKK